MTAPELKPCPFCGHPPYNDEQTAHVFGFRTKHDWAIACSNCEVSAPGAKTLSDAITAWNTRADIAAVAAEREAILAAIDVQPAPDVAQIRADALREAGNAANAAFDDLAKAWHHFAVAYAALGTPPPPDAMAERVAAQMILAAWDRHFKKVADDYTTLTENGGPRNAVWRPEFNLEWVRALAAMKGGQ